MPLSIKMNPGLKVTLLGAVMNLLLSIGKFVGGVMGNSTAMVADAIHSLSDLLTDAVVMFSHKIGQMPRDKDHPYGHGRAENIGATAIGGIIILAGCGLAYEVWQTIESGSQKTPGWIAAWAAVISILTKEWLFRYTRTVGEKIRSPSVVANAWHHRSDAISSVAALIGIVGAIRGHTILDPLAGGVVALMIARVGFEIASGGIKDLMDTAVSEEKNQKIRSILDGIPGVVEHHDLRTRRIGGEILMDVHILVNSDLTVSEGHQIADNVRRDLMKTIDNVQDVLVHVDAEMDDMVEPLYAISREELDQIIAPIIDQAQGVQKHTRFQVHFLKGKILVDLFVRVDSKLTIEECRSILSNLKRRLEIEKHIDEINVYLDINQD